MISMRKIGAIYSKNLKTFFSNPFLLASPIIVLAMAYLFGNVMLPEDPTVQESGAMMTTVLQMNIIVCAVMIMAVLIAEEKEKHTLFVLVTSTVSSVDFLLSNVLTTATVSILLNAAIYFFIPVEGLQFAGFLIITTLATIAAITLGATLGLLAKNQAAASTMTTPLVALMMAPMFFADSFFLDNVLYYVFTEQMHHGLQRLTEGEFSIAGIGILAANIAVFAIIFAVCYRKRGLAE